MRLDMMEAKLFPGADDAELEKRGYVSSDEIVYYKASLRLLHPIVNDLFESLDEGYPVIKEQVEEFKDIITKVINKFERLGITL